MLTTKEGMAVARGFWMPNPPYLVAIDAMKIDASGIDGTPDKVDNKLFVILSKR
jgi:hypothetical protein